MKVIRVVFDFIKPPVPEKINRGRTVLVDMTNNPFFPSPDVDLDTLDEATKLLEDKCLLAKDGGKRDTALMHQAEKEWDRLMRKQALYVDRIADGNDAIILSAGFNVSKQPVPAIRPEFSVKLGEQTGSVKLRRKVVQGAYAYVWQYCKILFSETEEGWTYATATGKSKAMIYDLTPVTKYWFRVAAVMADGTTAFSDPIMVVMA